MEIDRKYFVSGSSDGIIILWELIEDENNTNTKYILKQKLVGHEFSVIGLTYLNNDRLISASIDDTIKIWQRNIYEIFVNKIVIKEEKLGIEGLINIGNNTLITYSGDKSIKIWIISKNEDIIKTKNNENSQKNVINVEKEENKITKRFDRTESVDYMVQNSIKKLTEEDNKNKEKEKEKENKNEIFEINTSTNQSKI